MSVMRTQQIDALRGCLTLLDGDDELRTILDRIERSDITAEGIEGVTALVKWFVGTQPENRQA